MKSIKIFKKLAIFLITLVVLASALLLFSCEKDGNGQTEATDFRYALRGDSLAITGYEGEDVIIYIPAEVGGVKVTAIGSFAFQGKTINRIIIPEGVKIIEEFAFVQSTLAAIEIPSTVSVIGENPFRECRHLSTIKVSDDNIYFKVEDDVLFTNDGKKLIATKQNAFNETFVVPEGVEVIEASALSLIITLNKISLPKTLREIKANAFTGSTIKHFKVSDGSTIFSSEDGILYTDSSKTLYCYPPGREGSFTIPERVEKLADYAFEYSNIVEVDTSFVKEIGKGCFERSALERLYIDKNVEKIGDAITFAAYNFSKVVVNEKNAHYVSIDENALYTKDLTVFLAYAVKSEATVLILPLTVEKVTATACYGAAFLQRVELPASIKSLGYYAFYGSRIYEYVLYAEVPPKAEDGAPIYIPSGYAYIYVPDDSVEIYAATKGWDIDHYYDMIKGLSER